MTKYDVGVLSRGDQVLASGRLGKIASVHEPKWVDHKTKRHMHEFQGADVTFDDGVSTYFHAKDLKVFGIMSTNRPPMTVWASDDINAPVMGCNGPKRGHWCSVRSQVFRHGPYVHLEQFMEEVERRADSNHATEMRQYSSDFMEAMQELAKEIQEGKA